MMFRGTHWLALIGLLLVAVLSLGPRACPAQGQDLAADVKLLEGAGVAVNEPGLLALLHKHTVSVARRRAVAELIQQLGDDTFLVRENASRDLKAMGPVARAALQQASKSSDPEVAIRAKRCLKDIENSSRGELLACAARALTRHPSAQAVEALLAFLPDAIDWGVEEDVMGTLTAIAGREDKTHPALVKALTDKLPVRRAGAGAALAQASAGGRHREAARQLLKDTDPSVRHRVSLALACSGDRKVVPLLIDLLPHLRYDRAWQVDDVLNRLGGGKVLRLPPGEDATARKKYRDECLAWWKEHGEKANLGLLADGPRRKARMSARASHSLAIHPPAHALDGNGGTMWNAGILPGLGRGSPWIEVDLGASRQIGGFHLVPCQLPDGLTTHEIWVSSQPIGDDRSKATLVRTLKGHTRNCVALRFDVPKPVSGRSVQIRTTQSPSCVAWVEIELAVR